MQTDRMANESQHHAFDWASMWTSNHRGQLVQVALVAAVLLLGVQVARRFTSQEAPPDAPAQAAANSEQTLDSREDNATARIDQPLPNQPTPSRDVAPIVANDKTEPAPEAAAKNVAKPSETETTRATDQVVEHKAAVPTVEITKPAAELSGEGQPKSRTQSLREALVSMVAKARQRNEEEHSVATPPVSLDGEVPAESHDEQITLSKPEESVTPSHANQLAADDAHHSNQSAIAETKNDTSKPTDDTTAHKVQATNSTEELPLRELVLSNPRDSGGIVRYLVNDQEYSLNPGQTQRLPADSLWQVRYHRGGDFGNSSQVLEDGQYEFRVTDTGWQLLPMDAPQHGIGRSAE